MLIWCVRKKKEGKKEGGRRIGVARLYFADKRRRTKKPYDTHSLIDETAKGKSGKEKGGKDRRFLISPSAREGKKKNKRTGPGIYYS